MKPVRTASSNMVYEAPPSKPEVRDLHCQRIEFGRIRSVWWLTPFEREQIAAGGNLALEVLIEPIPPVSLSITFEQGIGEDDPDVLVRLERYAASPTTEDHA
jgi:hypothetical protein